MATTTGKNILKVGTRASLLARTQTGWVVNLLKARWPHLQIELVLISSSGDKIQDRPLHEFGGKGLFTKELEIALLEKQVDLAVHSLKDVPVTMPLVDVGSLTFAAVPAREDPRDALISRKYLSVDELPPNARVGTGSLRRRCQLLDRRPELQILPLRGNIDTRVRKLKAGDYDAVVLAMAGLKRANLFEPNCMSPIPTDVMLPAAAQGALALQCRADDSETRRIASVLDDAATRQCVAAERLLVQALNGDCHSPIAAHATLEGETMTLQGVLGGPDGSLPVKRASVAGPRADAAELAADLATRLR